MSKTMSKQELQDWINFLYSDLLKDNIYIGGYFFKLDQLKDFEKAKKELDNKSKAILKRIKERNKQLTKKDKNSSCSALQRAQNKDFEKLNKISVKVTTKNKFNEKLEFPVIQEEFFFIYNELEKAKEDVEHFKNYLLEELNNDSVKEEPDEFMMFINDYLQDIREKFSGNQVV